jgi:hypothetical protein
VFGPTFWEKLIIKRVFSISTIQVNIFLLLLSFFYFKIRTK